MDIPSKMTVVTINFIIQTTSSTELKDIYKLTPQTPFNHTLKVIEK
jgi:hypothetical protein